MSSPVTTITVRDFVQWGPEQDLLMDPLTVLSNVKPKDKIKIIDSKTRKIAIEDRSWLGRTLSWNGDGCKPTVEIITKIMTESFEFASRAKEHLAKRDQEKLTDPKLNSHPTLLECDKQLAEKFKELRTLLGKALWGMSYLRDLYGSYDEGEKAVERDLTLKINMHSQTVLGLYKEDEVKPRLPDLITPKPAPELAPVSSTTTAQAAIGAVSLVCTSVSWYGFVKSITGIGTDVHSLIKDDSSPIMKLGYTAYTAAKVINITGLLK